MSSTELISLVEQYRETQQLIEAAQAELEAIKAQVTAEMDRRGVSQMDAGTHRIRLQHATGDYQPPGQQSIAGRRPRPGRPLHPPDHDPPLYRCLTRPCIRLQAQCGKKCGTTKTKSARTNVLTLFFLVRKMGLELFCVELPCRYAGQCEQ